MAVAWSPEQIAAVAPDASSMAAARKLSSPAPWSNVGADEAALWGECKGSGKNPYQTQVDLSEPAFRCSCPSRKFPCKHALGLLLLWSAQAEAFTTPRPAWVDEWLASRVERAEKAERRAATADKPVDAEAQAKRMAARAQKVDAGLVELERWLGDLLRRGLAAAQTEPYSFWDRAGARLVDAQAPALAGRVRGLARFPASATADWPARLLEEASLLHLAVQAYHRLDELPASTQDDVRTVIGFTRSQDDTLAGPRVRDRWEVVGRAVVDDERLAVQRVWLHGRESDRFALILSFAAPGQTFDTSLAVGTSVDAELAFYPGAVPERALVAERLGEATPLTEPDGAPTFAAALARVGHVLAHNPFVDRHPMLVADVRIEVGSKGTGLPSFALRDAQDHALDLDVSEDAGWLIAALTGGHPCTLFGEWNHRTLRPLTVATGDRWASL